MRRIPSLRGPEAFGAVARAGECRPVRRDWIGITPSAVSHRIRGLEDELGVQLASAIAERSRLDGGRPPVPRRRRRCLCSARAGDCRTSRSPRPLSRPLTISLTSEIGIRWLMPQFHPFLAQHPDIDVAILHAYKLANLSAGEARPGPALWRGTVARLEGGANIRFAVSPLCAPRLIGDARPSSCRRTGNRHAHTCLRR